jgi:MoxR-like ATPase
VEESDRIISAPGGGRGGNKLFGKETILTAEQSNIHEIVDNITAAVSRVVIGKEDVKKILMVALLSQGHVLIEGITGTAKTTIARTFAHAIGGSFKRVQGTPDMLPADILGFYLYHPDGTSTFMPGPVFANVVQADELNRTTPRTQAALLEAMQEYQVTIERETHPLEMPFIVIASQVPSGGVGTSPLSDVQLDRFMFRAWSGFPDREEEGEILRDIDRISEQHVSPVTTPADIMKLQEEARKVHIADSIRYYIIDVLNRLRVHPDLSLGPSPRAGIALFKGSRALAFIDGRDFVIPDDVKALLVPALSHRLRMSAEAEMDNVTAESIINLVAAEVPVPKMDEGA